MRKILLFFSVLTAGIRSAEAQTVATFEGLLLSKPDTFYVNYVTPMSDVGFNDGLGYFPCYYDTSSFGGYWSSGFAYSNMTDSVTSGYTNEYSAKTAIGYSGSAKYAVAYCAQSATTGVNTVIVNLTGAAKGMPVAGFYVTNNTYAYNSMKNGDGFAKKFGGVSGSDPDWFKLTVKGMHGGLLTTDSVDFYLADYRFANNDSDYIVKTWEWVNLLPLGHTDSLVLMLRSTDTGTYGMNTPAYFCMDNFTTNETGVGLKQVMKPTAPAKVYPVPANDRLYVESVEGWVEHIRIVAANGQTVSTYVSTGKITSMDVSLLPSGTFILEMTGTGHWATAKFEKP